MCSSALKPAKIRGLIGKITRGNFQPFCAIRDLFGRFGVPYWMGGLAALTLVNS
jgi:hypothetical protein